MLSTRPAGLLVATLLLALTGCATLSYSEPPRVNLVGLRPLDIQLFEQRYRVRLRVQNPNQAALRIRGLDFELALNGKHFAAGVSDEQVEVPSFGEAYVQVDVSSSLVRLFEQFRALGERERTSLRYEISGKVAVEGLPGRLSFHREGALDLSPDRRGTRALRT